MGGSGTGPRLTTSMLKAQWEEKQKEQEQKAGQFRKSASHTTPSGRVIKSPVDSKIERKRGHERSPSGSGKSFCVDVKGDVKKVGPSQA